MFNWHTLLTKEGGHYQVALYMETQSKEFSQQNMVRLVTVASCNLIPYEFKGMHWRGDKKRGDWHTSLTKEGGHYQITSRK